MDKYVYVTLLRLSDRFTHVGPVFTDLAMAKAWCGLNGRATEDAPLEWSCMELPNGNLYYSAEFGSAGSKCIVEEMRLNRF